MSGKPSISMYAHPRKAKGQKIEKGEYTNIFSIWKSSFEGSDSASFKPEISLKDLVPIWDEAMKKEGKMMIKIRGLALGTITLSGGEFSLSTPEVTSDADVPF